MKRFAFRSGLFLLPVLLGLLVLLMWPMDKRAAYANMEDYCRNGNWMYHRIFEDTTPIDIAFLGSSMTMCAVNDSLLTANLYGSKGVPIRVANLGFCRHGRNLQLGILKDLLSQKKPKWIILEATVKEPFGSHPQYPVIAGAGDLLSPLRFGTGADLAAGLLSRLKTLNKQITNSGQIPDSTDIKRQYGFETKGANRFLSAEEKKKPHNSLRAIPEGFKGVEYRSKVGFPTDVLAEIVTLAKTHGGQVAFLYLPDYHSHPDQLPLEKEFISKKGEIWVAPHDIFGNPNHWMDVNHLNLKGATNLTDWLSKQL